MQMDKQQLNTAAEQAEDVLKPDELAAPETITPADTAAAEETAHETAAADNTAGTTEVTGETENTAFGSDDDEITESSTEKGVYRAKKEPPPKPKKPPKSKEQLEYEMAKNERFKQLYWQPFLWPVVTLVVICIVTSLLLGLTNAATAPVIKENARLTAERARTELLPEADGFEEQPLDDLPNVTAIFKATNDVGWVIESYGRGYGGRVPVMVAFDTEGVIVGVRFLENTETVGLGQKVRSESFSSQFVGMHDQTVTLGDIDKIASATISSGAAVNAVNAAIDAFNAKTGGVINQTPEEVRAALLPGETLTPITINAPEGVQPIAWVSDAGHYIIYGETATGRGDSIVVAAVAMDENGVILNLWLDTSGESESYGQPLARNQGFIQSFVGKSAPVEVDAVANVTSTSNSVMDAVNLALGALPLVKEAA